MKTQPQLKGSRLSAYAPPAFLRWLLTLILLFYPWQACAAAPVSPGGPALLLETWTATAADLTPPGRSDHTAVWSGGAGGSGEMIIWGGWDAVSYPKIGGRYNPARDTWSAVSMNHAPESRWRHTAIWTGSEMIVWGGGGGNGLLNSGGRYHPLTDTWTLVSTLTAPDARELHSAVWTGTEMIVWGGRGAANTLLNTGGRYNPLTGVWTPLSTANAPVARFAHTAVWTGAQMVVWGGENTSGPLNSGARYDPMTDTWTPVSTVSAPDARFYHSAVWTGTQMVVWGGRSARAFLNTGGRYDPLSDTWAATSTLDAPIARSDHAAVWTGLGQGEMMVWGGWNAIGYLNSGGRYDPLSDRWTAVSTTGAQEARIGASAVWSGAELVVWGGWKSERGMVTYLDSGGRYDPVSDHWRAISRVVSPAGRTHHSAVWAGAVGKMLVWGGWNATGYLNTGGRYDPAANTWAEMSTLNAPDPRKDHTAVWTGTEMVVWGGENSGGPLNSGARYNPVTDTWTPMSSAGAPEARTGHTAVWTGAGGSGGGAGGSGGEMLIWGGENSGGWLNSGARYDPVSDTWAPLSTLNAPDARTGHTALWTGTDMMVWGGGSAAGMTNSGARYNPVTGTWTALPLDNAPDARMFHAAVWSGGGGTGEMIIWGGMDINYNFLDTGGRYNPVANTWSAVSTTQAPAGRHHPTALWSGAEMIIWGGLDAVTFYANTGGRYDPVSDTWTALSTLNAPEGRGWHTAVWTGGPTGGPGKMIVWGGEISGGFANTGGVYRVGYPLYLPGIRR